MTMHEKAVRLCEGGVVEVAGHFVRAVRYAGSPFDACMECGLDSACSLEMIELCTECDEYEGCQHVLKFANSKK